MESCTHEGGIAIEDLCVLQCIEIPSGSMDATASRKLCISMDSRHFDLDVLVHAHGPTNWALTVGASG